ncbi:MAG TPA: hypothetical protein PKM88_13320, partial [bacterium]|nr:hypothetical protein [bacterium]
MDQTDRVLVRLLPAAGVLLLVLLLLCVAIDTLRPLQEYDIWLHLTSGEHIVRNRAIPTHDPYSFSAFGRPWVYHEWLFAVAVYGLYVVGGITALKLLQAGLMALLAAMVAALMLQLQPPSPWKLPGTVLWLLAGYFLLLPRFHLRPHQLSLLFLTLELFVLYRGGRWRWLLPPLFVFWANIHGDVIAGVALLGLWGWCRAIDGPRKGGRWLLAAGGALLLTLCNPYGWRLWQMAWRVGTFSEYQRYIYEWMPLRPEAYERITPALIMIALAAVMTAGRRRWFELALATFGVVAMLKAMRYTPLACIFATPLVAVALRAAAERWMARRWRAYGALAAAALAVLLFAHTQVGQSSGFGYKARVFPFPAFTFIRQHALHGRTFADYAYATAYSTCNLPGNPYYIDGRWDVFGEEIFRRFRATKEGRDWRALLDGERVDVVLLAAQPYDYAHERFPPLAAALSATAEWQLAFWDDISLVFIRRAAFPGFTAGYDRAWPVVAEAGKRDVPASGNIAAIVAQAQAGSPYGIWACQTGARLAQAAGDTQQAQEWYQQGLGQMPENAVLLTEYGQFLSDNGMETPALLAWELATSVAADYY